MSWFALIGLAGPVVVAADSPLAFPGAVGYGAQTRGGAGGTLYRVISLANSGPGTLREACEASGKRYVIIAVEGGCVLSSEIKISHGEITIDARTAPGNGFHIRNSRLSIGASDVIVHGLRSYPGVDTPGQGVNDRDGIAIGNYNGAPVTRIYLHRCETLWASDENMSTWGRTSSDASLISNVTIDSCLIAEGLKRPAAPFGPHTDNAGNPEDHSMGLLIGDYSRRITVVGNCFATNDHRSPQIKGNCDEIEVINNLIYNQGSNGIETYSRTHILGNVIEYGPITSNPTTRAAIHLGNTGTPRYYLAGNLWPAAVNQARGPSNSAPQGLSATPLFPGSGIVPRPAAEVRAQVLAHAFAPRRNGLPGPVAQQVLNYVSARNYPNTPSNTAPNAPTVAYPTILGTAMPADSDGDGLSDAYEAAAGGNVAPMSVITSGPWAGYTELERASAGEVPSASAPIPVPPPVVEEPAPAPGPIEDAPAPTGSINDASKGCGLGSTLGALLSLLLLAGAPWSLTHPRTH